MAFPKDFKWGVATSSYQIEGGNYQYGRGVSIWDTFCEGDGNVFKGHNGLIACDHVNRYADDVQLMSNLGVDTYRFSVSWARIQPDGTGSLNQQGLDFYSRLVDALLESGITPFLTLNHWDIPQAMQDKGGWEAPDSVKWFEEYTAIVSEALGDKVKHWLTHNEPFVVAMLGHLMGVHAPGKKDPVATYTVAHHLMLSHGTAVPIIRQNSEGAEAGITLDQIYTVPYTDSWEDRQAARRSASFHNEWFLEPIFRGTYPADIVNLLEPMGAFKNIDLSEIEKAKVPTDFLGINYYTRAVIAHDPDEPTMQLKHVKMEDAEHTLMGWEVYPDGLLHTLLYLNDAYYPGKIYITENGCASDDPGPENGVVDDPQRKAYFEKHIDAISKAIDLGVNVAGYFAWSFMDNFEWSFGYDKRFGLYHVDFETQERTMKSSAAYYRDRIKQERG